MVQHCSIVITAHFLTISGWLQGQVTCTSGSSVFTADASELDAALKAFQAGECKELNISSTSLIQCGGTLYERHAFLDALVRRILNMLSNRDNQDPS